MKWLKYTSWVIIFVTLTILTQVGGLAFLIGLVASRYLKFILNQVALPIAAYLILTFVIVPFLAPLFGREIVHHTDKVVPTTYITVLLNRNYVKPGLNDFLRHVSEQLGEGKEIRYLDANFPFFDGFPLLPHLSHNDGKKIDISLMYRDEKGNYTDLKPSRSGYGVFVEPNFDEFNQTSFCKNAGYWQYDFPQYLTLGLVNEELRFSSHHTKELINAFLTNSNLSKVFIEKHLVNRMNLKDARLRFQGCGAVRHDDHIHIQIK